MDVLTALVSVAIGALLGGGVNALVGRYASFKESQALAAALRAELEVLLDVVEGRDHVGGLERTIIYLSSMTSQAKSDQFYDVMRAANDTTPYSTRTAADSASSGELPNPLLLRI